ncbi:DnaJ domain-containing protein [Rhodococcus sp. NPDC056960]|uniref:DnaJ domain-containing protein n=1 Tax=Rhodococcus sp. NPDC056960 TaxID=3345982 RepID=UPI00362AF44F
MATERDPYRVLGLSPSASQADIASAYRRLLRRRHPTRTPIGPTRRRTSTSNTS